MEKFDFLEKGNLKILVMTTPYPEYVNIISKRIIEYYSFYSLKQQKEAIEIFQEIIATAYLHANSIETSSNFYHNKLLCISF